MHSIKSDRLEAGVLFAIQQQVHLAVAYSELVSRINSAPLKKTSQSSWKQESVVLMHHALLFMSYHYSIPR